MEFSSLLLLLRTHEVMACQAVSATASLGDALFLSDQGLWGKQRCPRIEMVHLQDMTVELSTHLLASQREIETLRIQLQNSNATIWGYMRMVHGQASDLYVSDIDTGSGTTMIQGSGKEPLVDSHSPFGSRTR
jgi:hypothetical protein